MPDVPTVEEAGLPGYLIRSWNGVCGPAGLARPVVEKLNRELLRVAGLPEIRSRLLELGVDTAAGPPEGLQGLMQEEITRYGRIVRDARNEQL